jgi:hypothetical protein
MALVKRIREKYDCSVNDVIMAAITGTMRRYGAEVRGDAKLKDGAEGKIEFKSMLMIGLPRKIDPDDMAGSIANRHLYASCRLPIDEPSPGGRLEKVVEVCNNLKSPAYMAGLGGFIDTVTAIAPQGVLRKAAAETFSKHSMLVTNVPWTSKPTTVPRVGGEIVKEVQMVFPNLIPQVSIISYNGMVFASIVADPALFPRPEEFCRIWVQEFDTLLSGR